MFEASTRGVPAVRASSPRPRPRVLIVSFTDLGRDPRVDRQIRFLAETHTVIAAGTAKPGVDGVTFIPLTARPKRLRGRLLGAARLVGRRYESYYWGRSDVSECLGRLRSVQADLIVANDIDTLPVALAVAGRARVLFDAHEYAPREFDDQLTFRLLHRPYRMYLCRSYIPRAHGMTTVCDSLAQAYELDTGVRPSVVWNAPDFQPLEPGRSGAGEPVIRLVHHGGAQRSRKLEGMIQMMRNLDQRFELHLILVGGDEAYLRFLRQTAGHDPRIRFHEPVPMRELPSVLNRFDVGVFLLPPTNFNYRYALPNKFFEFVQARLALAIGPSPEMARLVARHGLGLVAPDFSPESLAALLSSLDRARVDELKRRSHDAARALSADSSREVLLGLAERLLSGGP